MSTNPPSPICPICNYDLTGIPLDDTNHTICPECGEYIEPTTNRALSRQKLTQYTNSILLVFGIFCVLGVILLGALIYFIFIIIPGLSW